MKKSDLDEAGVVEVYSAVSVNNGVMGFTSKDPDYIVDEETPFYICFGDHTRLFNIARSNFCVMDNVKVLQPFKKYSFNILSFIVSSWKRNIKDKGYARHWSLAKKTKINLPTRNGEIDFSLMEEIINELKVLRIKELETYLTVTGLVDYKLTVDEEKALGNLNSLQWVDLNVVDLFDVKNAGNIMKKQIIPGSGNIPYLTASSENNGVSTYINYDETFLDKGNCVFIGGKTFVVSYQKTDFFSNDSHNLALYLKSETITENNQLFIAACIEKSLSHKYSWGDSVSNTKIKNDKVTLPIKNGKLNINDMELVISAIKKLVIKDVVLWTEEQTQANKELTEIK